MNLRLLAQQSSNTNDLQMLYSIIKTPRLCDEFHKVMRDKYYKQKLKNMETDCKNYLGDKISKFADEQAFLKNFLGYIGQNIRDAD